MKDQGFASTDGEDIDDWLDKVAYSFNIQLEYDELAAVDTFGQLCDAIANKIPLRHENDCTTQQAFYKLRRAITTTLNYNNMALTTPLAEVLPRRQRRKYLRRLEASLGHELYILEPTPYAYIPLTILLIASPFCFFLGWQIGLTILSFSLVGLWLAMKFGKELSVTTVGDLAEKLASEHYVETRRNPTTFNKFEIPKLLTKWASRDLQIDSSLLTSDAPVRL